MSDQTQNLPKLTAADFEAGLEANEAEFTDGKVGAFNKAEFAKNLAKFAPAALAFAAACGVPIPAGTSEVVQFVIGIAQGILGGGGTLPTA